MKISATYHYDDTYGDDSHARAEGMALREISRIAGTLGAALVPDDVHKHVDRTAYRVTCSAEVQVIPAAALDAACTAYASGYDDYPEPARRSIRETVLPILEAAYPATRAAFLREIIDELGDDTPQALARTWKADADHLDLR